VHRKDSPDDGHDGFTVVDAARWFVLFALAWLMMAILTGKFSPSCTSLFLQQASHAGRKVPRDT
jgi:hypothetical protein